MSLPEVTIATSIPPHMVRHQNGENIGDRYQVDCVASWLDAGFRIISINAEHEIAALARRFPEVEFVPSRRSAEALLRRKAPLISELLSALASQPRPIVGIINADICLEAGKDWIAPIVDEISSSILIAKRIDVKAWPGQGGMTAIGGTRNPDGFDLFFFEKSAIPDWLAAAANSPYFGMGVPWWDFWFPIVMALGGYRVKTLQDPVAAHLLHPTNYEHRVWELMATHLIEVISNRIRAESDRSASELHVMIEWAERLRSRAVDELGAWVGGQECSDNDGAEQERFRIELALFSRVVLGTLNAGIAGSRKQMAAETPRRDRRGSALGSKGATR